ncbi:hypothetical protein LDL59_03295 [Kaistella anthropi]|nr:hypothetical protein [Kaistella anthropi]
MEKYWENAITFDEYMQVAKQRPKTLRKAIIIKIITNSGCKEWSER